MKNITRTLINSTLLLTAAALLVFILINFILGCETWDQELWTETNSCQTVSQIYKGIFNVGQ